MFYKSKFIKNYPAYFQGDNEINKCMDPSQLMKHIIKNGEPYGTKYSRMDQVKFVEDSL